MALGPARARDDELTVWAAGHQAVVVSTDGEFSQRRMQNVSAGTSGSDAVTGRQATFSEITWMRY